jgi:phosphohistidine phosphatase
MQLYLVRHGPAEDDSDTGRDEDRALSIKGRARMRAVAEWLRANDHVPDIVYTSPLVRAVQTAEILVSGLRSRAHEPEVLVSGSLAVGRDPTALVGKIHAPRAMVVGHEPTMTSLLVRLTGGVAATPFSKGMVACVRQGEGRVARALFVLDPKSLTATTFEPSAG